MSESLLSVGIDLGTTTTQMVVSRLWMENTSAAFTVPRMEIRRREVLYRSPIHFTPLLSSDTLDARAIGKQIEEEYQAAGIRPEEVETGAVIITGETARKENAREVLTALSHLAGDFVVATAGPALESVLAARGAGADRYAEAHGTAVLHFDIGGGTSNLALFDNRGRLLETGCLNVGGRLLKIDRDGRVTYVSPVLSGLHAPAVGQYVTAQTLQPLVEHLVQALEEAAGLRPVSDYLTALITDRTVTLPEGPLVFSFSGGVSDLIEAEEADWLRYGDLGVLLGRAILYSELWKKPHVLGRETIRATVIGAGSYATELSGSTISYHGVTFPIQDLPAAVLTQEEAEAPPEILARTIVQKKAVFAGEPTAIALRGMQNPSFQQLQHLAEGIAQSVTGTEELLVVALEHDMAKALGQALRCRLGQNTKLVCLDSIHVPPGSYLDLAAPVGGGTAVPVVVKTLAFS